MALITSGFGLNKVGAAVRMQPISRRRASDGHGGAGKSDSEGGFGGMAVLRFSCALLSM